MHLRQSANWATRWFIVGVLICLALTAYHVAEHEAIKGRPFNAHFTDRVGFQGGRQCRFHFPKSCVLSKVVH